MEEFIEKMRYVEGVEVVGLVVSQAHDSYEMFVRKATESAKVEGPFLLLCDGVSKKFEGNHLKSAQGSKKRKHEGVAGS